MRWNCPHCGVALAVSDDKLGTGWSFSRCYKCGGHALVRRTDINLIKVDKAPSGERVLLPESSEEPMLPAGATHHMAQITAGGFQNSDTGPVVRKAAKRNIENVSPAPSFPPRFAPAVETRGVSVATKRTAAATTATKNTTYELPEPLPEVPNRGFFRGSILPSAIGLAGLVAIGSGIYLYDQGQQLWSKARDNAVRESTVGVARATELKPVSAPVTAIASAEAIPAAATPAVAAIPPVAEDTVTDQVHHNAMAPNRAETSQPQMTIQPRIRAMLRSGPGIGFSVLGTAVPNTSYVVKGWKNQWFNVEVPGTATQTARTAWIRNDMVKPAPAIENPELTP